MHQAPDAAEVKRREEKSRVGRKSFNEEGEERKGGDGGGE